MEVNHLEHTSSTGSQRTPSSRYSALCKSNAVGLRVPRDGKTRKSRNSFSSISQASDLVEFTPSHTRAGQAYRPPSDVSVDHDDVTCGSSRFSDVLLHSSSRTQYDGSDFNSKAVSANNSLVNIRNRSYSNISVYSTQSQRKLHPNVLNLAHLRQDLPTSSSVESQLCKGNSLAKQFLETASKTRHEKDSVSNAICASPTGCNDTSEALDCLPIGFSDKLFPMSKCKETLPDDMKMDVNCKEIPDYFSLDYVKHIRRDLTALEFRLKHFLKDVILPQDLDFTQNLNNLSKVVQSVAQLRTDIEKIKHDTKTVYLQKLAKEFDKTDSESFLLKLNTVMQSHISRLEALESKTLILQNDLEAKKLQLRKLENLIKLDDMINDFKRNMKLSEKLKDYYGTFGDVTVFALSLSLMIYVFRRWFVTE
ncbi:unnamed protein product [Kluyveromyces dobzhanskii CBS 2104]|uniref:WGS project CCBQ000000000 data, contig 00272 n=1 Tax=Kluyveromyces dobzhanskii CBS 2104 TaxID=1427455 RepID=A0A0A8LAX5_9SACH|nr:unnamed protein product [Kluyveromyces dobzhanskii CBS 2104]